MNIAASGKLECFDEGYIILRKPEQNVDEYVSDQSNDVPKFREEIYAGLDRMPWYDLSEIDDNFCKTEADREIVLKLKSLINSHSPLCFVQDFVVVLHTLKIFERLNFDFDLVFAKKCGSQLDVPNRTTYLGVDLLSFGMSYLRYGLFHRPDAFQDIDATMIQNGLIASHDFTEEYLSLHTAAAQEDKAEPIIGDFEAYEVYLVQT